MRVGDVIGGYRIEKELGAGGYGVVYRAVDVRLERPVALKVLKLTDEQSDRSRATRRARFEREAKAAARIKNDHIAQVLHLGESADGDPFIAMELVEGRTLAQVLSEERVLPAERIVALGRQICAGMQAAHDLGVVHRDLKPANLMLDGDRVKILDFGVAKLVDDIATVLTRQGEVVGTVAYMSPEQINGGVADARSDIYSLGTILYSMLVGRRPFDSASVTDLMSQIAQDPPPDPVLRSGRTLPDALVSTVLRCLEKDPDKRFQTMEAVSRALERSIEGTMRMPPVLANETTRVSGDALQRTVVVALPDVDTSAPTVITATRSQPPKRRASLVAAVSVALVVTAVGAAIALGGGTTEVATPEPAPAPPIVEAPVAPKEVELASSESVDQPETQGVDEPTSQVDEPKTNGVELEKPRAPAPERVAPEPKRRVRKTRDTATTLAATPAKGKVEPKKPAAPPPDDTDEFVRVRTSEEDGK